MTRETKYPYEVATFVQTDEKRSIAKFWGTYLICLFFVILTGLAIYAMFRFPPAWDLSQ